MEIVLYPLLLAAAFFIGRISKSPETIEVIKKEKDTKINYVHKDVSAPIEVYRNFFNPPVVIYKVIVRQTRAGYIVNFYKSKAAIYWDNEGEDKWEFIESSGLLLSYGVEGAHSHRKINRIIDDYVKFYGSELQVIDTRTVKDISHLLLPMNVKLLPPDYFEEKK